MKLRIWGTLLILILLFTCLEGKSNNISISSVSLNVNTVDQYALVQFSITWENSWRLSSGSSNWDAAWVFIKYRKVGTYNWQHAKLYTSGYTAPTGSSIDIALSSNSGAYDASTNPGVGAFIYRNTDGSGTFTANRVVLRWNYADNGLLNTDIVDVKVYACEMVYVTQGEFNAGGGGGTSAFTSTTINTPNATTTPSGSGTLGGQQGGYPTGQTAPSNASWPNGYNAFYCMKYELSQQQYVDFLNTLTYTQQASRTATAPNSTAGTGALISTNSNRSGIDIQTSGNSSSSIPAVYACNLDGDAVYGESNDGQSVACNYLSWSDLAAYLDWAALRPMTDLEWEKACRGAGQSAVSGELAWGSTSATQATSISNSGTTSEVAGNSSANTAFSNSVSGPMRVGCFATATSSRVQSGATYYGIMNMSGNLWDRIVPMGDATSLAYTGLHGDGTLNSNGNANVTAWPGQTSGEVTIATNVKGFRGGEYVNGTTHQRVSDRNAALFTGKTREYSYGGRGVRTAP